MAVSYITKQLTNARPDSGEDSYSDEELVSLAQSGYQPAIVILCRRYIPLITRYSHVSQLRSMQHDLEATLWECFLQAIQTYDFNSKVPFAGYAKSRVHFTEMNLFRHSVQQWNHESLLSEDDNEIHPILHIPATDNTEQEALVHLQHLALQEAISRIEPTHAHLLQQILFQGYSISDLAKRYGMSRQGMHKEYKKAIALVQEELTRYGK